MFLRFLRHLLTTLLFHRLSASIADYLRINGRRVDLCINAPCGFTMNAPGEDDTQCKHVQSFLLNLFFSKRRTRSLPDFGRKFYMNNSCTRIVTCYKQSVSRNVIMSSKIRIKRGFAIL